MILLYTSICLLFWAVTAGKHRKVLDGVALSLMLIVLIVTKTNVGIYDLPDLDYYFAGYEELKNICWLEVPTCQLVQLKCPEIGFRFILKFGSWLGSFRWSLLIIATIHAIAYVNLAKRYSPYVMVSLIIFLLGSVQSFFVLRQHLAIAITLFSYPYIINRDWKKFFLFMLLAFSFHQTAIIFVPVYFVYSINNKRKLNLFFVLMFLAVYSAFIFVFNFFATFLVGYESYMELNESNMTSLIISVCYLLVYVLVLRDEVYTDGINRLVFILLTINVIIMFVGYSFSAINRLMMYYSVVRFLSVPITMAYIRHSALRYGFCAFVLVLSLYLFCSGSNAEYLNAI